MDDRLNLGCDVRELKLGSTFYNQKPRKFHTLKYDFKPASVDVSKVATLDVSSNNQVTVTVPHLDGSGVPKTVFKGNQRNYTTKECVLIIDKVTGEITLEKLHHNIQVKKTRSESTNTNKTPILPQHKLQENSTQRTMSKTKVSTGLRKTPISANVVPRHSPLQGSPSYPHHKSPQQPSAPAWNANNVQSTLPSIPLIGMDDDDDVHQPGQPIPISQPDILVAPSSHQQPPMHHQVLSSSSTSSMHHQPERSMPAPITNSAAIEADDVGVLSSSGDSSDSDSSDSGSDSDSDNSSTTKPTNGHMGGGGGSHGGSSSAVIPPAHLLSEDLCLSESNSDSDDSD